MATCARCTRSARTRRRAKPTSRRPSGCSRDSIIWWCRTSSSPRPPSSPTWSCPGRRRGARAKELSPTPSAACSAAARRSIRPAMRATTSGSFARSAVGWATSGRTALEPREVAENVWHEIRSLSPMHAGMSYQRLEDLGGIQWPCPHDDRLEPSYLHGRLWSTNPAEVGPRAPFSPVVDDPPVEDVSDDYPLRLTTGRRLDSYNTGVQSGGYQSPLRWGESIDLSPEDADQLGIAEGESVRVSSIRGSVVAPARIERALRPGLVFMTFHFPEEVDTNLLTIDATDPKSGTAEFKAAAVRIDKIEEPGRARGCCRRHLNDGPQAQQPHGDPCRDRRDPVRAGRVRRLVARRRPIGCPAPRRPRRARTARPAPSLAARTACDQRPRRLDQPRRDQRAGPADGRRARRDLRGGHVLRLVQHDRALRSAGACLCRPGMPHRRRLVAR